MGRIATMRAVHRIGDAVSKARKPPTSPFDSGATVTAVDGGTAWVMLDGADEPMPVTMTIDSKPGDRVRVRVSSSGAHVTGNATAPPTDDAEAIAARVRAQLAKDAADTAQTTADAAAEAASDAAKTATNYITEIGTGGIIVAAEDASSSIQIADTVKVMADDDNYSEQTADGFDVYKDGAQVANFGDTVTIGRESELHTVMEPDAMRYIDGENTTVIKLDKDTFARRITGTDGTVGYTKPGETIVLEPSLAWWGHRSSIGTGDGVDLVLDANDTSVFVGDDWSVRAAMDDWILNGMPGTLALYVPDTIIDRWGIGNYLEIGSITITPNNYYTDYGDVSVKMVTEDVPRCIHVGDQYVRIAAAWVDGELVMWWVNPYFSMGGTPDDVGVVSVAASAASAAVAAGIPFGRVDSTSTATEFTATVPGITELRDGVSVMLENGVVTSAAGFTVDVNGLGAKAVYSNMSASPETTIFNVAYTMLFVYDSARVPGGCWICYRGYDSNTNTIGYQLRTNSANMPAVQTGYRYRLWLTDADGQGWVPINTSTYTNATTARALNTRPIDPFGRIVYCSHNATKSAGSGLGATYQWDQYTLTIGYSYVITLTAGDPVYLKCAPQPDGSAVMESIVQALPSTDDGKIYIFLGTAYSTTAIELMPVHPVYWNDGTGVRVWTAVERLGEAEINELFAAAMI